MELRYENGWTGNGWPFGRMNRMFLHDLAQTPRRITPLVDVVEEKDTYHFYFEMPGFKNDAFDVRVEQSTLIIAAERKQPEWPSDARVHVTERSYGTLRRAFELPEDASPDRINASYKDGVLEVTVEKRPESKPVKIQVN
jgi:HSP20 family protein